MEPTPNATVGSDAPVRGPLSESALSRSPDSVETEATKPLALKPRTAEPAGPADAAVRLAAALSSGAASAETVDTATAASNSALDALSQRLAASAGTRGRAIDNVADTSSVAMPIAQPVRTLEDTVTDLLRPMLRQWLDANMPRIVEKALRVELAEGVKPGVKTDAS
jgi:cell pole-organizing protein PopZ